MAAPRKILAILCVRNEAAYLLEWIAHHRAVGVTDFLVFSNDCQDGTETMLDHMETLGLLTHIRNDGPYHKGGIQFTAMKQADKHPLVRDADWIIALDVDEFINIHVGDRTIPALLDTLPEATAITLTWRLFGSGGQARYVDHPVTDQFTRCAPALLHWPWRAAMFKTLYANDGTYDKIGVHRPRKPDPDRIETARWFDGEGRELPPRFRNGQIFSPFGRSNYALAQLNHYPLGSAENFVVKADRGRAVHSDHMLDVDYWVDRNFNTDTDDSITALAAPRNGELNRLMADPDLAKLHADAVQWRKARFLTLLQQEPYRALYGRLLQTPPSQPLSPNAARFLFAQARKGKSKAKT